MDDETKAAAEEKANAISQMIGYPDFVVNPTKLDAHYANVRKNATLIMRITCKAPQQWVQFNLKYIFNSGRAFTRGRELTTTVRNGMKSKQLESPVTVQKCQWSNWFVFSLICVACEHNAIYRK